MSSLPQSVPSIQNPPCDPDWHLECLRLGSERHAVVPFRYDQSEDRLTIGRWVAPQAFQDMSFERVLERAGMSNENDRRGARIFGDAVNRSFETGKTEETDFFLDIDDGIFSPGKLSDPAAAQFAQGVVDCRWWLFVLKEDASETEHPRCVNGVAVGIGAHKEQELKLKMVLEEQGALLMSITENAAIALTFDISTGKRIPLQSDVLPSCFAEDVTLPQLIEGLVKCAQQDESRAEIRDYLNIQAITDAFAGKHPTRSFDCLMACPMGKYEGQRWTNLTFHYGMSSTTGHAIVLVHLVNINDRKVKEVELARRAKIDSLTGLLNLGSFRARCDQLEAAFDSRTGSYSPTGKLTTSTSCAFVLIELDDFNRVNDLFGYPYGDNVLREVAETLRASAHEKDVVGRLSGTQFAILMHDTDDRRMSRERIRILKAALTRDLGNGDSLTASIGVASCPEDGCDFDALREKADDALYVARRSGGNAAVFLEDVRGAGVGGTRSFLASASHRAANRPLARIRTFGYFDVFVSDKPVVFHSSKSKELLALLVDRQGGFVTSAEAISYLWESESATKTTLARYRKCAMRLKNTLMEYGVEGIIEVARGGARRVVPENVDCDLFSYLSGDAAYEDLFTGSYLNNYSWGEETLATLLGRQKSR